ncbi:MAG: cytochrome c nitrite reductase small subunit [Phycisphaeraceae bacterium]
MKWLGAVSLSAMVLSMLIGVLTGVGGYTFYFANGAAYFSNDPTACVNCHIMRDQYDGWQKASHHAFASCNDCHVPHDLVGKYLVKAENGYLHSKAFTFENFHEPIRMRPKSRAVVENNCLRCHGQFVSQITMPQDRFYEPIDCVRCHESVGHGPNQ